MDNHKQLKEKYISVYYTMRNWIKNDIKKNNTDFTQTSGLIVAQSKMNEGPTIGSR
jgi:hypothetical protein